MGVSAGVRTTKHGGLSPQGSVLYMLLEILCCVEGGLRNLWKESHRRVAFEVLELVMTWKIVSV